MDLKRMKIIQDISRMKFSIRDGDDAAFDEMARALDRAIDRMESAYA
jgi:hypothetical protein